MLLSGGMTACGYGEDRNPPAPETGPDSRPLSTLPSRNPDVLGVEAGNYAELQKRLAEAPGSVLLDDAGPADGPGAGFNKVATVMTGGPYTVTAACVGIPRVQIYLSQDTRTGTGHQVLEVECQGAQSRIVQLQPGYVSAQVTRNDPAGAWTGAVAGIKISLR